ncbi:MAG: hypothetical protein DRP93_00225 [Candidatus Neomarinimicrobiota bacterium]|nr:MAG: hypothetical protein DRP93_00225 [Candidatus Neomarinimicrobiota bacterium]
MKDTKIVYHAHKNNATYRGAEYLLTFEEWYGLWESSGKWEQKGVRGHQYVLGRKDPTKPFVVDNCVIRTQSENMQRASKGKPKSVNTKRLMSQAKQGKEKTELHKQHMSEGQAKAALVKVTCENCGKVVTRQCYGRAHGDKCKSF